MRNNTPGGQGARHQPSSTSLDQAVFSRPAGVLAGLTATGVLLAGAYFTNRSNSPDLMPADLTAAAAPFDPKPTDPLEPLVMPEPEAQRSVPAEVQGIPQDTDPLRVAVAPPPPKEQAKPSPSRFGNLTEHDVAIVRAWSRFPEVEEMLAITKEFLRMEEQLQQTPKTDKSRQSYLTSTLDAYQENLRYIRAKLGQELVEPRHILHQTEWWSTSSSERIRSVLEK